MAGDKLATRTVTGVIAGMVVATAAATAVGFWLSYAGFARLRDPGRPARGRGVGVAGVG